jgi:hypothetical protein
MKRTNKKTKSVLSLLLTIILVLGIFTSLLYAEGTVRPANILAGDTETVILFDEDFEENDGGFISGITEPGMKNYWEWGKATYGPDDALKKANVWATELSGGYGPDSSGYIESPDMTIPEDYTTATLSVDYWLETTTSYDDGWGLYGDYGMVQISADGGANWKNVTGELYGDALYNYGEIENQAVSLDEYIGKTIRIRFFFFSFDDVEYEDWEYDGWYIDRVLVKGEKPTSGETEPTVPAIPTGLMAEATTEDIILIWDASETEGLIYKIYRSDVAGTGYEVIGESATNGYADREIEVGKTYYYVITAVDAAGVESEYSDEVSTAMEEQQGETAIIFNTNFEKNNGRFTSGVTEGGMENYWEWGKATHGPGDVKAKPNVWGTNLSAGYGPNSRGYIESPGLVIPEDCTTATLSVDYWLYTASLHQWEYDDGAYGKIQISTDNGVTWTDITDKLYGALDIYTDPIKESKELNLGEYIGETVKIRFYFHSGEDKDYIHWTYFGWYIDEMSITGTRPESGGPEPSIHTVTFEVTPESAIVVVKDSEGKVIPAEENGTYKLVTGDYSYIISAEGYENTNGTFTVSDKDEIVTVKLEEIIPEPIIYTLTLKGEGLESEPEAGEIEENTEITIIVNVPGGKQIAIFSVNDADKKDELIDNKYIFTITEDTEVEVTYEDIPAAIYKVTVNAENGIVEGMGEYEEGVEVTLTAVPGEGYEFVNWTDLEGEEVNADNPYIFTMGTEDIVLTANFKKTVTKLAKPEAVLEGDTISWDAVLNAVKYTIVIKPEEGESIEKDIVDTGLDLTTLELAPGVYTITIVAKPEKGSIDYIDSDVSAAVTYTVDEQIPEPGTPKYELKPAGDDAICTVEKTDEGVLVFTVKQGITGFKHFGVEVKSIVEHIGEETVVFTHLSNNKQQGLNAIKADFDMGGIKGAKSGFNIEENDVIKVYIVDDLTNDLGRNPVVLH